METKTNLFAQATKLFQVARATAEPVLVAAGSTGKPSREVFELCRQECKREVPALDYDEESFRTTIQDLWLSHHSLSISGGRIFIKS